jgi:hypothetical protein
MAITRFALLGVATASLATALFIPDRFQSSVPEMVRGIHQAFFCLGALTVLSSVVYCELKADDGNSASQRQCGSACRLRVGHR